MLLSVENKIQFECMYLNSTVLFSFDVEHYNLLPPSNVLISLTSIDTFIARFLDSIYVTFLSFKQVYTISCS